MNTGNNSLSMKNIFLFTLLICTAFPAKSQVVTGTITDENLKPVPYATIFVEETKSGTITNNNGDFLLQLPAGNYHLNIRSLGFLQINKTIQLTIDTLLLNLVLKKQEYLIKEVKVFPGKEDPAYFIIRKAMAKARFYREQIKHYEADLYVKSNFTFTNIPKLYQNKIEIEGKKLKEYFKEDMTYVVESQNKITFDYPQKYNQEVIAKKTSLYGFDEPPVMGLITSNFYEERPNEVISPLSPLALKHYNFRYEGFITDGDFDIFKINVTPKRKSDELVTGYIYIVDQLWCIYNVDFSSSFEFFDYRIKQQYQNLGNQNWLPVSHHINGDLSMLGLKAVFYYGASLKYNNIKTNQFQKVIAEEENESETDDKQVQQSINKKEVELRNEVNLINAKKELTNRDVKKVARLNRKILKEQYRDSTLVQSSYNDYEIKDQKDSVKAETIIWDTLRAIPLTPAELESYRYTDSLMVTESEKTDTTAEKKNNLVKKIIGGHYDLTNDSTTRLSYNGLISPENFWFNTVDGYGYKQRFRYSANPDSGKYYTIIPQLGYAFNRKALVWSVENQFTNIVAKNNTLKVEFGKESRDFKHQNNAMSPELDMITTWFFAENYKRYYETGFIKAGISQRIGKYLNFNGFAEFNNFKNLENKARYLFSDEKEFNQNLPGSYSIENPVLQNQKSFAYGVRLNYRKRQRKPWLEESPFLFFDDFYSFSLSYRQGIKNVFSSVSDFSQVDFSFRQQTNISPNAGIEWQINTGYFFNNRQMHLSQFKHFKTSEILVPFTTFTNTFQLLNDYMPSTNNSYFNLGAELRTEYILLRYLSFLNTRTWSESFHVNYLTTPGLKNYWEAGYSLNSFFFIGNIGLFAGFNGNHFERIAFKVSIAGY